MLLLRLSSRVFQPGSLLGLHGRQVRLIFLVAPQGRTLASRSSLFLFHDVLVYTLLVVVQKLIQAGSSEEVKATVSPCGSTFSSPPSTHFLRLLDHGPASGLSQGVQCDHSALFIRAKWSGSQCPNSKISRENLIGPAHLFLKVSLAQSTMAERVGSLGGEKATVCGQQRLRARVVPSEDGREPEDTMTYISWTQTAFSIILNYLASLVAQTK